LLALHRLYLWRQLPAFGVALAILGGGREKKEDTSTTPSECDFHKALAIAVEKGESWPRLATMLTLPCPKPRL